MQGILYMHSDYQQVRVRMYIFAHYVHTWIHVHVRTYQVKAFMVAGHPPLSTPPPPPT